jgi:FkbM family methyltransferase
MRWSKQVRTAQHRLTRPARNTALPVLRGNGRGLRVRFGESNLSRAARPAEERVENTLIGLLHPGDVVYDIGANIGWYSLLAARCVGPSGRVIAFEPGLANAAYVVGNAETNRLYNVIVVPAAVSDQSGWATFLDIGSLQSRLDKDDDEAQAKRRAGRNAMVHGSLPVPVLALDAWIAEAGQPPPSIVKIDIEGAEIGALRGMGETLRSAGPTLIIELHGTRDAVLDLLDGYDYEHEAIEFDGPTRQAPWDAHVLARPRPDAPAIG